jgi:probable HAF family extracellular repeat protein
VTPGLPSSPHAPLDLNDHGEVVGMIGGTGGSYAFYWAGGTIHNLNNLTAGSGWDLIRASAINNHGQIVGFGTNPAGHPRAYLLTPIPEPSTLGGIAVSAAFLVRRRARR